MVAFCLVSIVQSQINFASEDDRPQAPSSNINFKSTSSKNSPPRSSTLRPTPTRSNLIRFPASSLTNETRLFSLNAEGHIECEEDPDCPQDYIDTDINRAVVHACKVMSQEDEKGICVEGFGPPDCLFGGLSCSIAGTPLVFSTSTAGQGVLSLGGVHYVQQGDPHKFVKF